MTPGSENPNILEEGLAVRARHLIVSALLLAVGPAPGPADEPRDRPAPGRERVTIPLNYQYFLRIQFAPDGTVLASHEASGSAPIILRDVSTGKELKRIDQDITRLAFAPDGQTLAVGKNKGRVTLWDTKTWRERAAFGKGGSVTDLAFSADGQRLATGHDSGAVRVWDLPTQKEIFQAVVGRESIKKVVLSPDGALLFAQAQEAIVPGKVWGLGASKLWQVAGGEAKAFKPAQRVARAAFTADGRKLLTTSAAYTTTTAREVQVWAPDSGRLLGSLKHKGIVKDLAVSPAGNLAATYSEMVDQKYLATDWLMTVWDVETGKELDSFRGHKDRVCALLFAPDGRKLATYSQGGEIKVWDLAGRTEQRPPLTLAGPQRASTLSAGLAFSADGRSLAAWSDAEAKVWSVADK